MTRLYPLLVSFLGSAGLGLALTYFVGVYLVFQPEFEDWAQFFVPRAVLLMVIPYVLLVAHMGLRYGLGQWLLERGAVDAARRYSSTRMHKSLVRGEREALKNRLVMARVMAFDGAYEEAWALLGEPRALPTRGSLAMEYGRWKMEVALRLDARERVEDAYQVISMRTTPLEERAAVLACMAELALRDGHDDRYREFVEKALWADATSPRATLSRTLGLIEHGRREEDWRDALAMLDLVEARACNDIPGRRGELEAYRATLLGRLGEQEQMRAALHRARHMVCDQWSETIVKAVETRLET
jgi:hypothetical protein